MSNFIKGSNLITQATLCNTDISEMTLVNICHAAPRFILSMQPMLVIIEDIE